MRWGRDRPRKSDNVIDLSRLSPPLFCRCCCRGCFEDRSCRHDSGGAGDGVLDILYWRCAEAFAAYFPWDKADAELLGHGIGSRWGWRVTIVGIAFSQNYSVERDVRMKAGDSVSIHNYQFTFREVKDITGAKLAGRRCHYWRYPRR